ncbi:MAG TPA: M4 family metallopeptidase [Gemmatimonadales bacterium]|nr:M4 family metallopeptidase [Gemmatimonadales bacterium]
MVDLTTVYGFPFTLHNLGVTMSRPSLARLSVAAGLLVSTILSCKRAPGRPPQQDVATLTQSSTVPMTLNYSPITQHPSFLRGRIPLAALGVPAADTGDPRAIARTFMRRNARVFGVDSTLRGLRVVEISTDRLGLRHVVVQQEVDSIPVYHAIYAVHIDPRSGNVVAVSSSLVPNIAANATSPTVSEDSARSAARKLVLHGQAVRSRLTMYRGRDQGWKVRLAWIVEVAGIDTTRDTVRKALDTIPARRDVVIDAVKGVPLDMLDLLYTARSRQIYNTNHSTTLPGTLTRSEGKGPVADADVDSAYIFLGATYDYYKATHGRDSYDNAGAALKATVHYSTNYENAFWNGEQIVFGDGFVVNDVTAHELTHAVTERTAKLEYRWQSGALNESFSDIFGAMVDRDDWLMGEDLPIGAIRDLEHPEKFGQPGNVSGWVATCSDNEGVHTNSGIFSKAFVNIATAIGKNDAERIFYRALTTPGYLTPQATLEDARGAAIQSAVDLFGAGSAAVTATTNGFDAVGLNGTRQPPASACKPVPSTAGLSAARAHD